MVMGFGGVQELGAFRGGEGVVDYDGVATKVFGMYGFGEIDGGFCGLSGREERKSDGRVELWRAMVGNLG